MMIRGVYQWSSVGGALHVVLDDWNIEDHHIRLCIPYITSPNHQYLNGNGAFVDPPEPMMLISYLCALQMLGLSEAERYTALALHEGISQPLKGDGNG